MADVITIAGSPSIPSRSGVLLAHIRTLLEDDGVSTDAIAVRHLNADDLVAARTEAPSIQDALGRIQKARAVIVGTPIYKAAYAGLLKVFLDLLPQNAFYDKVVFPIATGGAPGHLLAIDYSLKPLLGALGAQHILNGLYVLDAQIHYQDEELIWLDPTVEQRLRAGLQSLTQSLVTPPLRAEAPILRIK